MERGFTFRDAKFVMIGKAKTKFHLRFKLVVLIVSLIVQSVCIILTLG